MSVSNIMRFYVSVSGEYLGAYNGTEPEGSIEVETPPDHAKQLWGFPGWGVIPADPYSERHWRDEELFRADIELNKAQDGDGTGTVKSWREYRKTLRAWPSTDNFPSVRPLAPDSI